MKGINFIYTSCAVCSGVIPIPINLLKKNDWIRCNTCYKLAISPIYGTRPIWFEENQAVASLEKYSKEVTEKAKSGEPPVLFLGYPDVKLDDESEKIFGKLRSVDLTKMGSIKRFFRKKKNLKKILRYYESQNN